MAVFDSGNSLFAKYDLYIVKHLIWIGSSAEALHLSNYSVSTATETDNIDQTRNITKDISQKRTYLRMSAESSLCTKAYVQSKKCCDFLLQYRLEKKRD